MKFSNRFLLVALISAIITLLAATSANGDETTSTVKTTTAPLPTPVANFTIPKNETLPACLKVDLSLTMKFTYKTTTSENATVSIPLDKEPDYDGDCAEHFNYVILTVRPMWILTLNYTLDKEQWTLSNIRLTYLIDPINFPDAIEIGAHNATMTNLTVSSTGTGSSYRCTAQQLVVLSDAVTLEITNYQAEAFMDKDKKNREFDTATSCPADITGQNKLVPIIVGSCLALLVVLVLVAYIIGRRKHRPGYQQV